eukprot:54159-Chlamydomonas_euryale.AAC.1
MEVVPEPAVAHGGGDSAPDGGDSVPFLDAECARCVGSNCGVKKPTRSGRYVKKPTVLTYFMQSLAFACVKGGNVSTHDAVAYMTGAADTFSLLEAFSGDNAEDWLLAIDAEMS